MPKNYNALQRLFAGNNYDNLPSISAGNVAYTPVVFQPATQYTPSQVDTSILERSLGRIEERKNKVNQQRAAIQAAISNVKLNEKEDEFKKQYTDDILATIDAAAQTGDYSTALDLSTKLAGDVLNDQALMGRVRANEQYEAKRKEVESMANSGRISDLTKERWLAQNKYNFVPITDDNGNIIGSQKWEDVGGINGGKVWNPVAKVDLTKLAAIAEQFVKPEKGSKDNKKYTNGSGGGTSSSYAIVTEARLDEALDSIFASTFGAREALEQEKEDYEWKLGELEAQKVKADPQAVEAIQKDIDDIKAQLYTTDENNVTHKMSTKEYMTKAISPALHQAAYKWNDTTSTGIKNEATSGLEGLYEGMPSGYMGFNGQPFRAGSIIGMQSGYPNPISNYGFKILYGGLSLNNSVNRLGTIYNQQTNQQNNGGE